VISAGPHRAAVTGDGEDYQWGKTQGGKVQIVVRVKTLEGESSGQTISWFGYFTPKTEERTMQSLRYMGWKGNDLMNLGALRQEFEIVVEHEEYEGRLRAKVAWINRLGGGQVKLKNPMGDDELRHFAAQMKLSASKVAEVEGVVSESQTGGVSSGSGSASGAADPWDEEPPPPEGYYDQRGGGWR